MILNVAIYLFIVMELSNVVIMYFKPDFGYGNSMSTFKAWERSKLSEKDRLFTSYMVRWVANCKLIFIMILLVIALMGSEGIKIWGVVATILSIAVYFVTLHPLISRLDKLGEIVPAGYSKKLAFMIGGFIVMFSVALFLHLFLK